MNEIVALAIPVIILFGLYLLLLLLWRLRLVPRPAKAAMSPGIRLWDRRWLPSSWAALALALVTIAADAARRGVLGAGLGIAIGLAPLIPLVWFLVAWRREMRLADELDRRIHLEALSFAFPAFLLMMVGFPLLARMGWAPRDTSGLWWWMPLLYWMGTWMAKFYYAGEAGVPAGSVEGVGRCGAGPPASDEREERG